MCEECLHDWGATGRAHEQVNEPARTSSARNSIYACVVPGRSDLGGVETKQGLWHFEYSGL